MISYERIALLLVKAPRTQEVVKHCFMQEPHVANSEWVWNGAVLKIKVVSKALLVMLVLIICSQ